MFRKIVSNLAFSPALVGQLGFYAKRLKREEVTRRLGLVFTALALVVQSLTVFTPPESANAANASDMIRGGITTKKQILAEYDNKRSDFKDIMDYAGITRAELKDMKDGAINSKGQGTGDSAWQTWGRSHVFSAAQGEVKHVVPLDTGGSSTVYSKPLWLYDSTSYTIPNGSTYDAFVGHSAKRGAFAIMKDCGNLITTSTPKPSVKAHFIAASCETIRGKAFDGRDKNASITVYLYYGGPPGKGTKSTAIQTKVNDDNKFSVDVPTKYKKMAESTKVWGVMVPLAGWDESTVQFNEPVTIPGGCIKDEPKDIQVCDLATKQIITIKETAFDATKHSMNLQDCDPTLPPPPPPVQNIEVCELSTKNTITIEASQFDATKHSKNPQDCQEPCAEDDAGCIQVTEAKTGHNLTQGVDATTVRAQASDRIEYTVYLENIGNAPAAKTISEELSDVLEYSQLTQTGGGAFDETSKVLSWSEVTLQPGEKASRSFVVQMLGTIPTTARGTSEPSSYDCIMTNAFGNTVDINVACEIPKIVETTVQELPKTGPGENLLFAGAVGAIVTFFWARSRQLSYEVKLVRKDFNMGTI